jgi:DNA-binding SARP family transcriptional activator/pimeloyl-ACP methyl ester carboxylesterase
MEFRILGPLEATRDGAPVALGGPRQRALLARLLLEANRTIPVDQLVEDLWGEDVPDSAVKMVHVFVSHLRKVLPRDMLATNPPGYAVRIDTGALDLFRFGELEERGRAALARGEAEAAAALLREALALWRGDPLGEFDEPFAAAERPYLEERRLACREERIDADLSLGRHADVVAELERLVAREPQRERLRGQLMLALYRSGRQAEALAAYREFRDGLDRELGIEPSGRLKELELAILRQDEALEPLPPGRSGDGGHPSPRSAPVPALTPSEPRFVRSGTTSIAYQVVGEGPLDLILVHGWVCGFHAGWERPQIASFYRRLASLGRLVLFDKRGTGMSDRVNGIATLEERMDDVRAVLDAVGSERAVLLGVSEGGAMVTLFAATYPERTTALVAMGTYARRMWAPDYPLGAREENVAWLVPSDEDWGMPVARRFVAERAPSLAGDEEATRWYASYIVRGATPGAAAALAVMNAEIDVRAVLPTIGVPALVLYREDEYLCHATRYMGERIPRARIVALPGADHLPWEGDQDAVLDEIEAFLLGARDQAPPSRVLATVLFWEGLETAVAGREEEVVRSILPRYRGMEIATPEGRRGASFDGPARAIQCAFAIERAAHRAGFELSAGLHTGECDLVQGTLRGLAVQVAPRVAAAARPGEVLASSTVKDLVAGSGISFRDRKISVETGGRWSLYAVER